jgi:hypothetical protein
VIVTAHADGVTLGASDVFTDLHAELDGVDTEQAAARFAEVGSELTDEHVWLDIAWLRAAGPDDDDWRAQFDAMIGYARSKGWVDEPGTRVRAHVQSGAAR